MKNYSENEIKYVVWRGTGSMYGQYCSETDQDYYDSLSAANDAALGAWDHLTRSERRSNYICVGWVTPADIYEEYIDDGNDDQPWWEACDGIRTNDDYFDSLKYEAEQAIEQERRDRERGVIHEEEDDE